MWCIRQIFWLYDIPTVFALRCIYTKKKTLVMQTRSKTNTQVVLLICSTSCWYESVSFTFIWRTAKKKRPSIESTLSLFFLFWRIILRRRLLLSNQALFGGKLIIIWSSLERSGCVIPIVLMDSSTLAHQNVCATASLRRTSKLSNKK